MIAADTFGQGLVDRDALLLRDPAGVQVEPEVRQRSLAFAEVMAIKEKGRRFLDGRSTKEELAASTPIMPRDIGILTKNEAVAVRRAVTLDMEMRIEATRGKVEQAVAACDIALEELAQHRG